MLDQGSDPNLNPPTQPAPEESSNRTFMIAVGILVLTNKLTWLQGL